MSRSSVNPAQDPPALSGYPDTPEPEETYRPNAEDCSQCDPDQMSYPFICPGHAAPPAPKEKP